MPNTKAAHAKTLDFAVPSEFSVATAVPIARRQVHKMRDRRGAMRRLCRIRAEFRCGRA